VALLDSGTNQLIEYSATGDAGQSGAFDWHWSNFSQSAFGMWTGVDYVSGDLTSRVSLPLNEAAGSYSQRNSAGSGVGTQQYAPLPLRRFQREDVAAVIFLDYVFQITKSHGVEYSASVCREANGQWFYWDRPQIGTTGNSPGVIMEPEQCADGASTVAHTHTHPSQHSMSRYPSGYSDYQAYVDVDRDPTNGLQPSDLKIANDLYNDHPNNPRYTNLTWYLAGSALTGETIISRYKKNGAVWAEDNIYRYNSLTDTWTPVNPAPW
jgi:hypothetical protein